MKTKQRTAIPKLNNPPIVEAVCEIRCEINKPYSLMPGALYERIKKNFPKVEELPMAKLGGPVPDELKFIPAHRFLTFDGRYLAQIGPQVCSINALKPYSGFEDFEKQIEQVFDGYKDIAEPSTINRIGLRYINLLS